MCGLIGQSSGLAIRNAATVRSQCAKGGFEKFEYATVMAAGVLVRTGSALRSWGLDRPLYRDPCASLDHGVGASEVMYGP